MRGHRTRARLLRAPRSLLIGAAAAALLLAAGPAAPATAGPTRLPAVASTSLASGSGTATLTIRLVAIARMTPVTIGWGDGTSQRVTTDCSRGDAARTPRACGVTVRHTYGPGSFVAKVRASRQLLSSVPVEVPGSTSPSAPATEAWLADMLTQVNAARAAVGAPALTLCPALARTADSYAQTIARTGHFDHTGPDGSSPWDRMQANGYRGYSLAAENIAAGQRSVDAVMTAWLNSPGHAANIRNPALRQFGAGRATSSGRYGIYWVQEFGTGGTCA